MYTVNELDKPNIFIFLLIFIQDDHESYTIALYVDDNITRAESFRITINITSVPFRTELADRSSVEFRDLARDVGADVEHIYHDITGQQSVSVLQFRSVVLIEHSHHHAVPDGNEVVLIDTK